MKNKKKATDEDGSEHFVECSGSGLNNLGCVAWVHVWLPMKIPKGFMDRPFLCGYCAAAEMNELSSKLDNMKSDLEKTNVNKQEKSYAEIASSNLNISVLAKQVRNEEKMHQDIANNLVIYGSRPSDDAEKEMQLVREIGNAIDVNLDGVKLQTKRLGKIRSDGSQLLRVTMLSEKKGEFLKKAKELRKVDTFKQIYIHPDLTPGERQQQYLLRQELKKMRHDEPEKKWKILKNRVIEVPDDQGN